MYVDACGGKAGYSVAQRRKFSRNGRIAAEKPEINAVRAHSKNTVFRS